MLKPVAAAAVLLALAGTAQAETFPSRPITLINPFTAGGPVDVELRSLATQAEKVFGVPVVVDNKPGAGATLGPATMAATARPDGYTVSDMQTGVFALPYMQKVSYDPLKDFTYILRLSGSQNLLVVPASAPWKTWKEFVADAKSRPNDIPYGSSGLGSNSHLVAETVFLAADIKLRHVPFRGMSEVFAALLGDHVKMGPPAAGIAQPLTSGGQLRPLLSTTAKRNPHFPDVPSMGDEGLRGIVDVTFSHGIGGPKGMKPEIVKILHDGFKKAMETPEHMAVVEQMSQVPAYLNSADYTAFAVSQNESLGKLLDALKLKRAN